MTDSPAGRAPAGGGQHGCAARSRRSDRHRRTVLPGAYHQDGGENQEDATRPHPGDPVGRSGHPDRLAGLVPVHRPRLSGSHARVRRVPAVREKGARGRARSMSDRPTARPGKVRAIGLLSGGLDSTLAARVLLEQGIEVIGLHYSTGFCMNDHRRAMARPDEDPKRMRNEGLRAGADLGIPIEVLDAGEAYLRMVLNPRHGYGSRANPCIDCRIFMIHGAAEYMREHGGHFVFTGEVLGQRPMSQHMQSLRLIEKECGIEGYLLRPLSARHLPPTLPEQLGWVDRDRLLGISGRSRKEQMEWSRTWGISDYPQPAGRCCYLADENFAKRFHDKKQHASPEEIRREELILLKVGRHFRLGPNVKIIVARDEA